MESLPFVKKNGGSVQKAEIAGSNRGENTQINDRVRVLNSTLCIQQVENLYSELWQIFNPKLSTCHCKLSLVDFIINVVYTKGLTSELRERKSSENKFPSCIFVIYRGINLILAEHFVLMVSLLAYKYLYNDPN